MTDMIKLKPCPFCAGEAIHALGKTGAGTDWHYIECDRCGATSEPDQWNTRLIEDHLVAALKLGLEYWSHRQQRYKNRSPVWVEKARQALELAGVK